MSDLQVNYKTIPEFLAMFSDIATDYLEKSAGWDVEWMMGLPEGHVTGVPGLSRTAQLKLLGNGVVPQQAEYALSQMGL